MGRMNCAKHVDSNEGDGKCVDGKFGDHWFGFGKCRQTHMDLNVLATPAMLVESARYKAWSLLCHHCHVVGVQPLHRLSSNLVSSHFWSRWASLLTANTAHTCDLRAAGYAGKLDTLRHNGSCQTHSVASGQFRVGISCEWSKTRQAGGVTWCSTGIVRTPLLSGTKTYWSTNKWWPECGYRMR